MVQRLVVIGLGVVGNALLDLAVEKGFEVYGLDIDPRKSLHTIDQIDQPVDFVHIAFPYSKKFVDEVINYIYKLRPLATLIHSTVPPGTTRAIFEKTSMCVAYTPIRGMHHKMRKHIEMWTKWVAVLPREKESEVVSHLRNLGLKVRIAPNPESLELAKLWETVYRAIMIAAWQEVHRIAMRVGADIKVIAEFVAEVHEVLRDRPVYYPGAISGTCLIPNTEMLNSIYKSKILEFVLESNKLREIEIKDPKICEDVQALRNIFMRLTNREYYTDP